MLEQAGLLALFGSASLLCAVAVFPAREIQDVGARHGLMSVLIISAIWSGTTTVRLVAPTPEIDTILYQIGLIAGITSIGAWLYFTSAYTGHSYHQNPTVRWVGIAIAVVVSGVKLTNPWHGLYFSTTVVTEPFPHTAIVLHSLHWIVAGVAYSLVAVGLYMLYEMFRDTPHSTHRFIAVISVTALPALVEVLAHADLGPMASIPPLSYSPLGMAAFVVGSVAYVRMDLRSVPRQWRQDVIQELSEAVIAVDAAGNVRDINPAAATMIPELDGCEGDPLVDTAPSLATSVAPANGTLVDPRTGAERQAPPPLAEHARSDGGTGISASGVFMEPEQSLPVGPDRTVSYQGKHTDSPNGVETVLTKTNDEGEEEYYAVSVHPLTRPTNNRDEPCSVAIVLVDITGVEKHRQKLMNQNKLFDEFADAVTHEVRNALTLLEGNIAIARQKSGSDDGHTEASLTEMQEAADRINAVVGDLASMAEYSKSTRSRYPVDIKEAARAGYRRVVQQKGRVGENPIADISVDVVQTATVTGDVDAIEELFRIFVELVAATGGKQVTIGVHASKLIVTCEGPAVPPERHQQAMEYGEPIPTASTGMLLPNAALIAEANGWTAEIRSGTDLLDTSCQDDNAEAHSGGEDNDCISIVFHGVERQPERTPKNV